MLPRRKFLTSVGALLVPTAVATSALSSDSAERTVTGQTPKPHPSFVPTGHPSLDAVVGELHDGDLLVVGGRPASGRASLLLSIAAGVSAGLRRPAVIFSAPFSAAHIRDRMSNILARRLRCDTRAPPVGRSLDECRTLALGMLDESHLLIDDRPGLSIEGMAAQVFRNNIRAGRRSGVTLLLGADSISNKGYGMPPFRLASALRDLGEIYGGPVLCRTTFFATRSARSTTGPVTFEPTLIARRLARASSVVLLAHGSTESRPDAPKSDEGLILMTRSPSNQRGLFRMSLGV